MGRGKLAVILGIRPDVIRASLILKKLKNAKKDDIVFIWSGQHYSDNLKDIFFRELDVPKPDIELGARGETDSEQVASVITKLSPVLDRIKPAAAVFLGDTNTVMGSIAAAQLNIPIVHIEGCMRSYDWRMPEEKYRTTIDHLSDIIYTYFEEYKKQGVREGLNPENIIVVQNLIVDILNTYYFQKKDFYDELSANDFFTSHGLKRGEYYLMTCHRRENVHIRESFENILYLIAAAGRKVFFPASYRTQKVIKKYGIRLPDNVIMVSPVGYQKMLVLMVNSRGVLTDSGTVVEEACVLGVPSVQIRKSTERPEVYDARSSVKFDPEKAEGYPFDSIYRKLENLYGKKWKHNLGDGDASERVAGDLLDRLENDGFCRHKFQDYHLKIARSYREDEL